MRITSESDYALRIITALARHSEVVDAKTLADETSVTLRFALKILHKLVTDGLVDSYKGVKGGYLLRLSPEEITLLRVIELIDGPIAIVRCLDREEGCTLNNDKTACRCTHAQTEHKISTPFFGDRGTHRRPSCTSMLRQFGYVPRKHHLISISSQFACQSLSDQIRMPSRFFISPPRAISFVVHSRINEYFFDHLNQAPFRETLCRLFFSFYAEQGSVDY